jgi:hypothetical protein
MSPKRKTILALALAAAFGLGASAARGQLIEVPGAPRDGETFTVIVENDVFGGTDRNYTNGLLLYRLSAANDVPEWYANFVRWTGFIPEGDDLRFGVGLGHSIFTPEDREAANPPLDQRPYAGWLYGSVLLVAENQRSFRAIQVNLGVVGPSAQGEFVQDNWHQLIDTVRPRGWDYQLKDEPGLLVLLEHRWRRVLRQRIGGFDFEMQGGAKAALGNVATYGGVDALFRLGPHIGNDYGPPRIRPSLAGAAYFDPPPGFNWYLFGGGEVRAVAQNIFLDGNTWRDSRSVDRLPVTGDIQVGLALQFQRFQLAFTGVHRFEEYEGQDGADRFGALVLSWQF